MPEDLPPAVKFISEVPAVEAAIIPETALKAAITAIRGDLHRRLLDLSSHLGFYVTNDTTVKQLRWDVRLHPTAEGLVVEVFPMTDQADLVQKALWNSLCTYAIADMKVKK